jgi:hypothetical protein
MNLKYPHSAVVSSSRSALFDALMDGYVTWREESAAVNAAYENWRRAPREERARAYWTYVAALDLEERAAFAYQQFVEEAAA